MTRDLTDGSRTCRDTQCLTTLFPIAVAQTDTRVCVPVPMFHTFGTVIAGVLMGVRGVSLVFPSTAYNETANLAALERERCYPSSRSRSS